MIVVLEKNITEERTEEIIQTLERFGFSVHRSRGEEHNIIGAIGVKPEFDIRRIKILEGVRDVVRVTHPYRLAGRDYKESDTIITVGDVSIGGDELVVISGPCAVENENQIFTIAETIAKSGAKILRGGAYKPRTSPYAFQGLGEEGLRLLSEAGKAFGLVTITEVLELAQIDLIARYIDIFQVGARNMQNTTLLKELGKIKKPVMLKRGPSASYDELLMSAEYMLAGGNESVILCERGIRTFENGTRYTMDISAIPVLKERTHLPVIADPSHAGGIRNKIAPLARAAAAAGADGLMIEVHHDPIHALSDGPQALLPDQFAALMQDIRAIAKIIGKRMD